jgi:uncharacterized protein YndB with AHSA1/START domain
LFQARVERTFAIGIDTMWTLWTDPQHLGAWHRPSTEFGPTVATADVRPGGSYRLEMLAPTGEVHATSGIYVDVDRPHHLSFTWKWDGTDHDSLVDITSTEDDGKTTVAITHTRLVDQADADRHAEGWIGCLHTLAELY